MADSSNECNIPQPIQCIGCQDLLEMKCTHCGWLRKRRTLKLFSWPQAYVVIYDGCLYYFKNEKVRAAAGKFSLYGYNAVYRASEIPMKEARWCFKIVHYDSDFKTYYFSASSEQEMKVWMSKIKQAMLHANGKSAIYGKNLHYVKEEKPDKLIEDPSFYQQVEENIYDDSSTFVPSQDYQKQYSIKKKNEDSDSEDEETETVNPSINDRPPQPLPHKEGPFVTLKAPYSLQEDPQPPIKAPLKPPRVAAPATPPRTHRGASPSVDTTSQQNIDKEVASFSQRLQVAMDYAAPSKPPPRKSPNPQHKRRGSYEKTDGPGNKSPSLMRRGQFRPVDNTSGGGSTGEDEQHSDTDEDCAGFYFDDHDKIKANKIIENIGEEGVYLVRPENNGSGKVLVVGVVGGTKKYRIQQKDDEYFLAKEGYHHTSVEGLLRHYYHCNLPTVDVKLKTPYKTHPKYTP